jgi:ABC-2 type transport system ATP-binding protein
LDDPVSGLDPLVRHEFLEQIIDLLQKEGRTVLFSSHILDEVERIADHIVVLNEGRVAADAPLEALKAQMKRIVLTFEGSPPRMEMKGVWRVVVRRNEVVVSVREGAPEMVEALKRFQPKSLQVQDLDLSQIFVELVKDRDGVDETQENHNGGEQ